MLKRSNATLVMVVGRCLWRSRNRMREYICKFKIIATFTNLLLLIQPSINGPLQHPSSLGRYQRYCCVGPHLSPLPLLLHSSTVVGANAADQSLGRFHIGQQSCQVLSKITSHATSNTANISCGSVAHVLPLSLLEAPHTIG